MFCIRSNRIVSLRFILILGGGENDSDVNKTSALRVPREETRSTYCWFIRLKHTERVGLGAQTEGGLLLAADAAEDLGSIVTPTF